MHTSFIPYCLPARLRAYFDVRGSECATIDLEVKSPVPLNTTVLLLLWPYSESVRPY